MKALVSANEEQQRQNNLSIREGFSIFSII